MDTGQIWTIIGLATAFGGAFLTQIRSVDWRFVEQALEIQRLTGEVHRGFGELRGDIAVMRGELRADIAELRADFRVHLSDGQ